MTRRALTVLWKESVEMLPKLNPENREELQVVLADTGDDIEHVEDVVGTSDGRPNAVLRRRSECRG